MGKRKVLFICGRNRGRSQIAEAYLNRFGGIRFEVSSAGMEPAERVHPLVIEVMKEEGIDLTDKRPQSAFELFKSGQLYNDVITLCPQTESRCPVYPGITRRQHWPFPDPDGVSGSREEQLEKVRNIRDAIKDKLIAEFSLNIH
ncbi:MAG: arsenate reductase ArsC [Desulfamplus sp.]|nr:arsenate reductase ArsC [Desulfamplus sp.]